MPVEYRPPSNNNDRYRILRHKLRAQWRDLRVLLRESRVSLILFVSILLGGGLFFHYFYTYPDSGLHPSFSSAFHATFALIFFETLLPFPEEWYLQIFFFIIPIFGLAVVADGLLRFGGSITNKQARGQKWEAAMASTYHDHVIVCGTGKTGYRIILELLNFGLEVVAVESNPDGRFVEKAKEMHIPVIVDDASRSETLIKAGVKRARAIVPCTNNEMTNLEIALDARELNPDIRVVLRMFDADLARRIEKGFDIHIAFSTSALAAPIFAAAAMRMDIKSSFRVGDELLNLCELEIQPEAKIIGTSVGDIEGQLSMSIIRYQGVDGESLHPQPEQILAAGDRILVMATLDTLQKLDGWVLTAAR